MVSLARKPASRIPHACAQGESRPDAAAPPSSRARSCRWRATFRYDVSSSSARSCQSPVSAVDPYREPSVRALVGRDEDVRALEQGESFRVIRNEQDGADVVDPHDGELPLAGAEGAAAVRDHLDGLGVGHADPSHALGERVVGREVHRSGLGRFGRFDGSATAASAQDSSSRLGDRITASDRPTSPISPSSRRARWP